VNDLMAVHGEYEQAMRMSTEYFKETGKKFTLSAMEGTDLPTWVPYYGLTTPSREEGVVTCVPIPDGHC